MNESLLRELPDKALAAKLDFPSSWRSSRKSKSSPTTSTSYETSIATMQEAENRSPQRCRSSTRLLRLNFLRKESKS